MTLYNVSLINMNVCIMYVRIYICIVSDSSAVINHYYNFLERHMDADSVSHMMHCNHLITDDDYEAITTAPNDIKMNTVLLEYVRAMNMSQLISFCDVLKDIETQKLIGDYLSDCKHTYTQTIFINQLCITCYALVCKYEISQS